MRLKMVISLAAALASSPLGAQTQAPKSSSAPLAAFSQSLEALAARVDPAVVQIVSTGYGRGDESQRGSASLLTRQRSVIRMITTVQIAIERRPRASTRGAGAQRQLVPRGSGSGADQRGGSPDRRTHLSV